MTTNATRTPVTVSTTTYRDTIFEISASYARSDNTNVEQIILKADKASPAELIIGIIPIENNPNCETLQQVDLTIAEVRILRELLNRPDVQAILDA